MVVVVVVLAAAAAAVAGVGWPRRWRTCVVESGKTQSPQNEVGSPQNVVSNKKRKSSSSWRLYPNVVNQLAAAYPCSSSLLSRRDLVFLSCAVRDIASSMTMAHRMRSALVSKPSMYFGVVPSTEQLPTSSSTCFTLESKAQWMV